MDDRYEFDRRHYRFVRDSRLTPAHFRRDGFDPDLMVFGVCVVLLVVTIGLILAGVIQ